MKKKYPIIEFDPSIPAIIEPSQVLRKIDISEHTVICFFQDIISKLFKDKKLKRIATLESEKSLLLVEVQEF